MAADRSLREKRNYGKITSSGKKTGRPFSRVEGGGDWIGGCDRFSLGKKRKNNRRFPRRKKKKIG